MNRVIKEPLFSFLVLSVLIFAVFQYYAANSIPSGNEIRLSEADIQRLARDFKKKWLRSPTEDEMDKLVDSWVREEVLYREALAIGLDQNDREIRRRLSQKMLFLSEDISPRREPTEQELQAFLDNNQLKYRREPRFSFRHIYFDSHGGNVGNHKMSARQKANRLLIKLKQNKASDEPMGDPLMIARQFSHATAAEIKRLLGSEFLSSLQNLSGNGWHGPIKSSFGIHLVRLDSKREAKNATLDEVRERVIRDWMAQQQRQKNRAFYEGLRQKYSVTLFEQEVSRANVRGQAYVSLASKKAKIP